MKIAIAGTGYVGFSNGVLLAQHNEVICLDIGPEKVAMLNRKESPIEDAEIEEFSRAGRLISAPRWTNRRPISAPTTSSSPPPPTTTPRPTISTLSRSKL